MTGIQFKGIRESFDLGVVEWGRVLGYHGNSDTISRVVRRYEGIRCIPLYIERLALMYYRHGIPEDFRTQAIET